MTLIAGAITKDGVVIRSDKRRTIRKSTGAVSHHDDLDKVYVSADKRRIIYNHGINLINGKSWRRLASAIDASLTASPPTDALMALNTAEAVVGGDASKEIAKNMIDEMTAFVVLFKDPTGTWHAGEISWHRQQGLKKQKLGRFFWSGSGAEKYFCPNANQKTDQHSTRYSDGGICAVGNLLKFLANDNGVFLIAEFGHNKSAEHSDKRDIEYIRVAPFIMLPQNAYRIENLGTGQVRLNYTVNQVWDEIAWDRDITEFYDLFIDLAIVHYQRVSRDAMKRIEALEEFRKNGYKHFTFGRR